MNPRRVISNAAAAAALVGCLAVIPGALSASDCADCEKARALYEEGRCKEAIKLLRGSGGGPEDSLEAGELRLLCHLQLDSRKKAADALKRLLGLELDAEHLRMVRGVPEKMPC